MAFEKGKKVSLFSFLNPHCIGYCTGWFFLGSCPTALDHVRAGASIPSLYSSIADGIQAYYAWGPGDAFKAQTQHAPGPMLEMLLFTTLSHDSCLSEDTETSIAWIPHLRALVSQASPGCQRMLKRLHNTPSVRR